MIEFRGSLTAENSILLKYAFFSSTSNRSTIFVLKYFLKGAYTNSGIRLEP